MAAGSSSCSCHVAGAFPGWTEEKLIEKIKIVWGRFSKNFPSFKVKKYWEVALLHKGYFKHYSLLFTVPGCHEGLLIHLVVYEENQTCLDFRMVDLSKIAESVEKTPLGTTPLMSAAAIISGAHDLLVHMGSYHSTFNNCQDYCQLVAKFLSVSVPFTGADTVAVAGGTILIGGLTLYGLYKLFSSNDYNKEDDDEGRRNK